MTIEITVSQGEEIISEDFLEEVHSRHQVQNPELDCM